MWTRSRSPHSSASTSPTCRDNGKAPPADTNAREAVDLVAYPSVQEALDNPTLKSDGTVDQSKTTHHVAAACAEAGLSLEQTRWAVDQDPDLAKRVAKLLARSTPRDDVQVSWDKARRNAWAIPGAQQAAQQQAAGGQAAGPTPPAPSLGGFYDLADARIGAYIAETYLRARFLYSGAFGWMEYDGKRWISVGEPVIGEAVRLGVLSLYGQEALAGATAERLKAISALFSASRISAIVRISKGYLAHGGDEFDSHPFLLNCGNGVCDLRDGSLSPHDPKLLLTKVTMTEYHAGAIHPDWDKALTAVTLEEAAFLQERFGHGLTAYPPSDDRLIVFRGSGENGKSTIMDGVNGAASSQYAPRMKPVFQYATR